MPEVGKCWGVGAAFLKVSVDFLFCLQHAALSHKHVELRFNNSRSSSYHELKFDSFYLFICCHKQSKEELPDSLSECTHWLCVCICKKKRLVCCVRKLLK